MCRVLGVSRSGYYACGAAPAVPERTLANATLVEEIRRVHAESDGTYGSRRVHAELRREGREVNHKRIERLMRVEGIQGAAVRAAQAPRQCRLRTRRRRGEGLAGSGQARLPADRPEPIVVFR